MKLILTLAASTVFCAFAISGASAEPGVCRITGGTNNGIKFVTIKCALESQPSEYKIRKTTWQSEDAEAYGKLARAIGRTFRCDLVHSGRGSTTHAEIVYYKMENCR